MPLPGDVTTCTVTFGPYADATGAVAFAGMTGSIRPSWPVRHVASGAVIVDEPITVTIGEDGTATVELVHTDLSVIDPPGFTYAMTWKVRADRPSPGDKIFVLPATDDPVDYDVLTLPGGDAVPVSVPVLLSFAGLTGAITPQQVADAIGAVTSEPNTVVLRDTEGNFYINDGTHPFHPARRAYVDGIGSNDAGAPGVVRRDANGRTGVVGLYVADAPIGPEWATRKDYVDGRIDAQLITDWNTALLSGTYYSTGGGVNVPEDGKLYLGQVEGIGNAGDLPLWITQTVHEFNSDDASDTKMWRRSSGDVGGGVRSWSPWYRLRISEAEQNGARHSLIAATTFNVAYSNFFKDVVIGNVVQDTAGAYDPATGYYTIPATGTYDVLASLRAVDGVVPANEKNLGLGVDLVGYNDSPFFTWYPISDAMRQGWLYNRTRLFSAGDVVRFFCYASNNAPVTMQAASLSITLIRKGA